MDFKHLEIFVKVFELKSFTRAADELYISQPTASSHISALEKHLQTMLIFRSPNKKSFAPTKAGEIFYEYAKDMLALRDKSIATLKSLSDCGLGSISILASSVPAQYILPKMIGDFRKLYPHIIFSITQGNTADVVEGILLHKGEIGFVGAKTDNKKCIYEHFLTEKMILIAPNEERYQNINQEDIKNLLLSECFVIREHGSGTRIEFEKFLKTMGITTSQLKISASLNNTQSIIQAVANGLGVSFVSELAAQYYLQQKLIISLTAITSTDAQNLPERNFYIVQKKDCPTSPAVDAFLEFIRLGRD